MPSGFRGPPKTGWPKSCQMGAGCTVLAFSATRKLGKLLIFGARRAFESHAAHIPSKSLSRNGQLRSHEGLLTTIPRRTAKACSENESGQRCDYDIPGLMADTVGAPRQLQYSPAVRNIVEWQHSTLRSSFAEVFAHLQSKHIRRWLQMQITALDVLRRPPLR